jgi:hypothetical protein
MVMKTRKTAKWKAPARRLANPDRRLRQLLDERDKLLVAWRRNTEQIAALSTIGPVLDALARPEFDPFRGLGSMPGYASARRSLIK